MEKNATQTSDIVILGEQVSIGYLRVLRKCYWVTYAMVLFHTWNGIFDNDKTQILVGSMSVLAVLAALRCIHRLSHKSSTTSNVSAPRADVIEMVQDRPSK